MDIEQCFSLTYKEARGKFLNAARSRDAMLESHVHPFLEGPAGEDLAVDVARLGAPRGGQVLMIVSGTHGVEGYAGSGCQTHFLQSEFCAQVASSTEIVLVHAINPYGFAYSRRTNEANVDLNRNFVGFSQPLPVNPHYAEYAKKYLPASEQLEDYQEARDRLARDAAERGGYQFYKRVMQPGQPILRGRVLRGLGRCLVQSDIPAVCCQFPIDVKKAAVLDIHTGLGPSGVGELIFMTQEGGERYGHLFPAPVSCAGAQGSVTSNVKGPLITAAQEQIDAQMAICCVLEFGTVPLRENVEAKIFENWTHRYFSPEHPLRVKSTKRMRDAYFCDTPEWKRSVINRATEIVERLHGCLNLQ